MRVTDLIPWTAERRNQPASRRGSDPVAMLQGNVNRAFDDFLRMFPIPVAGAQMLPLDQGGAFQVDVTESDKEVKVTAELPGVEEGDIDVRVSDGMLTISAEKKAAREEKANGYLLRERSFGRVERTLPLPEDVDPDAAQASFKGGVLTVTFPKTGQAESESSRRIPVQSS
jgi:HSP20 family protein